MSLNVRRDKILQAANWLATNSILYREQGISFSTDRATSYSTNLSQNESKTGDVSQPNEQISDTCSVEKGGEDRNQLDDWTEDDAEMPAGVTDTMLTATCMCLCPKHSFQHKHFPWLKVNSYKEKSLKFQSRVLENP